MIGKCPICFDTRPLQEHHVVPREYGGENGPTKYLCSSCHDSIHRQVNNELSNGPSKEFFTPVLMQRARPYIEMIIKAKLIWEETHQVATNKKVMITGLTGHELAALHSVKQESGFRNLDKYMQFVVRQLIKNR